MRSGRSRIGCFRDRLGLVKTFRLWSSFCIGLLPVSEDNSDNKLVSTDLLGILIILRKTLVRFEYNERDTLVPLFCPFSIRQVN